MVFSARQHAERAICCCKSGCPSVCLSITRVDQSKMVELRVVQFSPYSIYPDPSPVCGISFIQNSDGIPLSGGVKRGWVGETS